MMALRLNWPDERYVRIYCRDTIDWSALSWGAQALYVQLNRKADRRGYISLGRLGRRGLAALLGRADLWSTVVEPALAELEADGCVWIESNVLLIADFVEAQESVSSGRARQRKLRESRKAIDESSPDDEAAGGDETSPHDDEALHRVTRRHAGDETSQGVTAGYSTAPKVQHGSANEPAPAPVRAVAPPVPRPAPRGSVPYRLPQRPTPAPLTGEALTGEELTRAFSDDLEAEADARGKHADA